MRRYGAALFCVAIAGALATLAGIGIVQAKQSTPARPSALAAANKAMADGKAAFSAFDYKTAIADFNAAATAFEKLGNHAAADAARKQAAAAECNELVQILDKSIKAGDAPVPKSIDDFNPRLKISCTKAGILNLMTAIQKELAQAQKSPAPPRKAAATSNPGPAEDPKDWIKLQSRAIERADHNDFAGSASDWEAVARIMPDGAELFWVYACQNRLIARQAQQALADCNAGLAADVAGGSADGGFPVFEARGLIYLQTGDYTKALADFQAAAAAVPRARNLYGRALAKFKLGDIAGAKADLADAVAKDVIVASDFARYGIEVDPNLVIDVPACRSTAAASPVQDLSIIPNCAVVFCASDADPHVRMDLRHIDDALAELQLSIAQVTASLQKFQRACRAIGGDMTREGPDMNTFRDSVMDLSLNKGRLADLYDALQRDPEERLFSTMGASMARQFRQPACMTQMTQLQIDGLNAAQDVLAKADIDCSRK